LTRECLLDWPIGAHCGESLIDAANGYFGTVLDHGGLALQTPSLRVCETKLDWHAQRLALQASTSLLWCSAADRLLFTIPLARLEQPTTLAHTPALIHALAAIDTQPHLCGVLDNTDTLLLYDRRAGQQPFGKAAMPIGARRLQWSPSGTCLLAHDPVRRAASVLDLRQLRSSVRSYNNVVALSWLQTDRLLSLDVDRANSVICHVWNASAATGSAQKQKFALPENCVAVRRLRSHADGFLLEVENVDNSGKSLFAARVDRIDRWQTLDQGGDALSTCIDRHTGTVFVGSKYETLAKYVVPRANSKPKKRLSDEQLLPLNRWRLR